MIELTNKEQLSVRDRISKRTNRAGQEAMRDRASQCGGDELINAYIRDLPIEEPPSA